MDRTEAGLMETPMLQNRGDFSGSEDHPNQNRGCLGVAVLLDVCKYLIEAMEMNS